MPDIAAGPLAWPLAGRLHTGNGRATRGRMLRIQSVEGAAKQSNAGAVGNRGALREAVLRGLREFRNPWSRIRTHFTALLANHRWWHPRRYPGGLRSPRAPVPPLELSRQQLKNRFLDLFTPEHLLAHSAEVVVRGNHGVMEGFSEIWADQKLLQRVRCCG